MFERDKIIPFKKKVWLASPLMHGDELAYINDAFEKNWITSAGENVNEMERILEEYVGCERAVGLASGTAALHLAMIAAGEDLYGPAEPGKGALNGKRVFCSDMTFCATANPVVYEGGLPVFIDCERDTWNMDPQALREAFLRYPEVKLVVCAHLYGTPAKMDEIVTICREHGAVLIEDAAESLGASYKGKQTGSFGRYNIISFNGNKIITGSAGGCLLTDDSKAADKVHKLAAQAREHADWYQHEEIGYNYRISNIIAGVVRGQFAHLEEHIEAKAAIYKRYEEGLKDTPLTMNPYDRENSVPNFWLSCVTVDEEYMGIQDRGEKGCCYVREHGKTCPSEILEVLYSLNTEGRPIWKPMHMQPVYRDCPYVTAGDNAGEDIFRRGVCLPSDINMTPDQQDEIIKVLKKCFD